MKNMLVNATINKEDIIILCLRPPNSASSNFRNKVLLNLKKRINSNTLIDYLNILLSLTVK